MQEVKVNRNLLIAPWSFFPGSVLLGTEFKSSIELKGLRETTTAGPPYFIFPSFSSLDTAPALFETTLLFSYTLTV